MCKARAQSNRLKAKLKYIKIKHSECLMHNAAARQERQLINRGGSKGLNGWHRIGVVICTAWTQWCVIHYPLS
jgi:hypothetical protein